MRLLPIKHWWELLPEAVLGLGLGFFALTEWSAARSAFKSATAIVLMVVAALVWVGLRLGLARADRLVVPRTLLFAAGAAFILTVVVLPAYDDETVVETLPVAAATTSSTGGAAGDPATAPTTVATGTPTTRPAASNPSPTTTPAAAPLPTDELTGIDHRASGTVRIHTQADGTQLVGLEDIDIQPGPDYDVFIVPGIDKRDVDNGVRLDDLRGNKGTQFYAIPQDSGFVAGQWTVMVWCQTFDVPVAHATPA